jgi:MerR family transcriptional regulator, light-induced transcriptional regulator
MNSPLDFHSPKQVAQALGVSESSLKRWCDRGFLQTTRTAGGHRKLQAAEVIRFAPELLGLPPVPPVTDASFPRTASLLAEALLAGEEALVRQILFNLAVGQPGLARIFDDVVARAFVEIGERWACQQADVYQERRGCEIILRVLVELRKSQPPATDLLTACGGTATGNIYSLQTLMAEIVLRECGYKATSLGTAIPFPSLVQAVREIRPTLFWLSAAYIADEPEFLSGFAELSAACAVTQSALVVGGRALMPAVLQQMPDVTYIDNMQQLSGFARSLARIQQRALASPHQPSA